MTYGDIFIVGLALGFFMCMFILNLVGVFT